MNNLVKLQEMGFKVTWKLISLGLRGFENIPIALSLDEVFDFLIDCLEHHNTHSDDIIYLLCNKSNEECFRDLIKEFAAADDSFEELQQKKWYLNILNTILQNNQFDFMQGLLELLEFWTSANCFVNCPHEFPSNKGIPVQEYFTEYTYNRLIIANSIWLKETVDRINQLEKHLESL